MIVLNFFEMLKVTKFCIGLRKNMCTKISKKQNYFLRDEVKLDIKYNSNHRAKYNECIKNGISSDSILLNNWIFSMNLNNIKSGLALLEKWNPQKMEDLFLLLQLPMPKLLYFTKKTVFESKFVPHGNRVYYLATKFEKNPQEVCSHMIQYKFLFTRNFQKLNQIYEILIENGVDVNDLWNDVWVFTYSIDKISQRIMKTKSANLLTKPWMLRCKPNVFERTIEIKQENRVILNTDSTAQYLAKRLNVSEKTICSVSSKYPTMLRINPIKLKEILDFLLKEGFRPSHILSIPRVLTHSISTLQERFTELKDLGYNPTLTALCKNKTSYQALVDKLILINFKEENNL